MLINIAKRNVIIKLCLVGVIQALYIILVPPPLQRALELNDLIFLIAFIVVPIALNIFFTIKILCPKPEYIKFRYVIIPFLACLIMISLFFFTGIFSKYVRVIIGTGAGSNWNSNAWIILLYFALLVFYCVTFFISSIVNYIILSKLKNKKI